MFFRDPFFTTYPEVAFQEGAFDTTVLLKKHLNSKEKDLTIFFKVDVLLGSNTQEGLLFTQVISQLEFNHRFCFLKSCS